MPGKGDLADDGYGHNHFRYCPWKPCLQKRLRVRWFCCGNHLGCLHRADEGLQYGLSGNRVLIFWQHLSFEIKGKPPVRQRQALSGENPPDLSRKIYLACCRHYYAKRGILSCRNLILVQQGKKKSAKQEIGSSPSLLPPLSFPASYLWHRMSL